jgi:hypothetical protein
MPRTWTLSGFEIACPARPAVTCPKRGRRSHHDRQQYPVSPSESGRPLVPRRSGGGLRVTGIGASQSELAAVAKPSLRARGRPARACHSCRLSSRSLVASPAHGLWWHLRGLHDTRAGTALEAASNRQPRARRRPVTPAGLQVSLNLSSESESLKAATGPPRPRAFKLRGSRPGHVPARASLAFCSGWASPAGPPAELGY